MRKSLVVGINNYRTCPLSGCINDANEISKLFERHSGGKKNFDVKLIQDIVTKGELRSKIKELFKGSNEIELFYFSGHGYINVKRNNISYNMSLPVWRAIFLPCLKKPYSADFSAMHCFLPAMRKRAEAVNHLSALFARNLKTSKRTSYGKEVGGCFSALKSIRFHLPENETI